MNSDEFAIYAKRLRVQEPPANRPSTRNNEFQTRCRFDFCGDVSCVNEHYNPQSDELACLIGSTYSPEARQVRYAPIRKSPKQSNRYTPY